jgi:hypothetical protein
VRVGCGAMRLGCAIVMLGRLVVLFSRHRFTFDVRAGLFRL